MEGNGTRDVGELDSFEWVWHRRLLALEARGGNPDHLANLRQKVAGITAALQEFRTQRKALGDSGTYTAQGLADKAAEEAAKAAGVIQRICDSTYLREHIRQTQAQLKPQGKADPTEALLGFWKQMEIRSTLANQGIGPDDPLKANIAYRDALERGDHETLLALEGWPLGSPVDAALIQEGQAQRQTAVNPIAAAKLHELTQLQEHLARAVKDALQELPLASPDPLVARASGAPPEEAA
jgi:hypothetical protein